MFTVSSVLFALFAQTSARAISGGDGIETTLLKTGQTSLYKDLSTGYALPPVWVKWPAEAKCFDAIDNSTRHVTGAELKDVVKRAYNERLTTNDKITKAKGLKSYTGETIASDGNFVVFVKFYSWVDKALNFAVDVYDHEPNAWSNGLQYKDRVPCKLMWQLD